MIYESRGTLCPLYPRLNKQTNKQKWSENFKETKLLDNGRQTFLSAGNTENQTKFKLDNLLTPLNLNEPCHTTAIDCYYIIRTL